MPRAELGTDRMVLGSLGIAPLQGEDGKPTHGKEVLFPSFK
jgi:hypothetical protein